MQLVCEGDTERNVKVTVVELVLGQWDTTINMMIEDMYLVEGDSGLAGGLPDSLSLSTWLNICDLGQAVTAMIIT